MAANADRTLADETDPERNFWFQKFWALMGLALFGVTWKLWTPQSVFPQIPFFEFLTSIPGYIDWIALSVTIAVLLRMLLANRDFSKRFCLVVFSVATLTLVLLNQHRLQPWTYQFLIFAVIMASCSATSSLRLMRWITVSIYVYSAISKFDFQFVETLGPDFVGVLAGFAGVDTATWGTTWGTSLVLLLPAFELLMGIGLSVRRSRRWALGGILLMHGLLILILGPLGLNHQPGVLVWNMYLLGQAWFLFGDAPPELPSRSPDASRRRPSWLPVFAIWLTVFAIAFPSTVSLELCDHWLGWEVYAPRNSRAVLEFSARDRDRLPAELQRHCVGDAESPTLTEFKFEKWSLEVLGVPIYPEDRFQFGVAVDVVQTHGLADFRIKIGAISSRVSGNRTWKTIDRNDEIKMQRSRFWLNSTARRF